MKIRFSIFLIIFFLSANINAAISQSGITGLKQLDSNGIVQLISGNQLTGFISDGPFQGPITHSYYKNGKYEGDGIRWYKSGKMYGNQKFVNGKLEKWTCWYENGKMWGFGEKF